MHCGFTSSVRPSVRTLRFLQAFSTVVQYGVLNTALLEWVSEYAVRANTIPDSAVAYSNYAQIAQTTPLFALVYGARLQPKIATIAPMQAKCGLIAS